MPALDTGKEVAVWMPFLNLFLLKYASQKIFMCIFAYLTSTLKVFLCACVQRMHVYMFMCMYI